MESSGGGDSDEKMKQERVYSQMQVHLTVWPWTVGRSAKEGQGERRRQVGLKGASERI